MPSREKLSVEGAPTITLHGSALQQLQWAFLLWLYLARIFWVGKSEWDPANPLFLFCQPLLEMIRNEVMMAGELMGGVGKRIQLCIEIS